MPTTNEANTISTELTRADPNRLPDALRRMDLQAFVAGLTALSVEEAVTVTSHIGTLANVALVIQSINATTAGSTGTKALREDGATPGAGEVTVSADQQTITFAAADTVTVATVFYLATPDITALSTAMPQ